MKLEMDHERALDLGSADRQKTKLPKPGLNSPMVWDNELFLTGADPSSRQISIVSQPSLAFGLTLRNSRHALSRSLRPWAR
jgi:hypothetical protein